jgi:hypothetical protein
MKYLIDFNGCDAALKVTVESIGARLVSTHPFRHAAMALDAKAMSTDYLMSPQDYLRKLAIEDAQATSQSV